ncbi:MAG: hypothetical protein KGI03_01355 [Patescibacteria group bacterium]|nr:hypothetical protein [Patescibacteria group bacterium]
MLTEQVELANGSEQEPELVASLTRQYGDYTIRVIVVRSPATALRREGELVRVVTRRFLHDDGVGEELVPLEACDRLPLQRGFQAFLEQHQPYPPQDDAEHRRLFEAVRLCSVASAAA